MDLTLPIGNITLNIRVAVVIKTEKGFILEKSNGGYFFVVGGRVKVNETSLDAAKREMFEELGLEVLSLKFKATIELFFGYKEEQVQEICFVYESQEINGLVLGEEFGFYTMSQIYEMDVRPSVIKQVLESNNDTVMHIIERE